MLSVSDILKILDKIPVWKSLKELPAKVEELERRVAELEATEPKAEFLEKCVVCGAAAKVTDVRPHAVMGDLGLKTRVVTCEEGHIQEFDWDPCQD